MITIVSTRSQTSRSLSNWGVNVHQKSAWTVADRRRLERLCRYITRPPVAQERLEHLAGGRLELAFKRLWKDGTRAIVLEPEDLMVRLVAAVREGFAAS